MDRISKRGIKNEGRPPKFKTPEELQKKIEEYFIVKCGDEALKDVDGNLILDAKGKPIIKYNPPTVSGLALYLGFLNRTNIYEYLDKGEAFSDAIKKAIAIIEDYAEKQLFVGNSTGAIFWLKNKGWSDRQEVLNKNVELNYKEWLESLE